MTIDEVLYIKIGEEENSNGGSKGKEAKCMLHEEAKEKRGRTKPRPTRCSRWDRRKPVMW